MIFIFFFIFWEKKVDKGVRGGGGVLIFMFRVYIWEGYYRYHIFHFATFFFFGFSYFEFYSFERYTEA